MVRQLLIVLNTVTLSPAVTVHVLPCLAPLSCLAALPCLLVETVDHLLTLSLCVEHKLFETQHAACTANACMSCCHRLGIVAPHVLVEHLVEYILGVYSY
jgi:hypothetical protein